MSFEKGSPRIDDFAWGSDEFVGYIGTLPDFGHNNQYFKGLQLLLKNSPEFVYDSDLWREALPNVHISNIERAMDDFFRDLRGRLRTSELDNRIVPYQLRGFHSSLALPPLAQGDRFLPKGREHLLETMTSPRAQDIARVVYPVTVSGSLLRSNLEARNFAIVDFLLQKPEEPLSMDFMREKKLIDADTNLQYLKDAIDHKFRDLGLPTRLTRQSEGLGIKLG